MLSFQKNIDLAPYTTFGVHARAKLFIEINAESEIGLLLESEEWNSNKHIFLGMGANTLFTQDFDGLVVKINLKGKLITQENEKTLDILVGAGEDWNDFVLWSVEQNLGGIENLVGIPSSVGASAIGNIGAYGMETKDSIVSVQGIDLALGDQKVLSNIDCHFDYRDSIFKHELKGSFLVTGVTFRLHKIGAEYSFNSNYRELQAQLEQSKEPLTAKKLSSIILSIRESKLPDRKKLGTAGSFFKNPIVSLDLLDYLKGTYPNLVSFNIPNDTKHIKLSAGQLIELAGFKGYRKDYAGVYEKHALILVNYDGNAHGEDIVALAHRIQDKVKEMFHVDLEPEVIYV